MISENIYPIIVVMLSAAVVLVGVAYIPLIRWVYLSSKKGQQLKEEAEKEAKEIADQIIAQARQEAKKILGESESLTGQTGEIMEEELAGITSKAKEELAKSSSNATRELNESMERISEGVKSSLREMVDGETNKARQDIANEVNSNAEKVRRELTEYREQLRKKVDDEIYSILERVFSDVVPYDINWKRDARLIKEALEEAKKLWN
jgi:F0F1-type ATP synthase membrane subunit b/b'